MKIKNKHYRQFLDNQQITLINIDHITQALNNIKGQFKREGRALLITLYYTGARPIEVLKLKSNNFTKEGNSLLIQLPASKRGLPRIMRVSFSRKYIKELWKFTRACIPEMFIFYHYKGSYIRETKTGQRIETTDKLRYYIKEWFKGVFQEDTITPYLLRHNRFSKLSIKGLPAENIRILKGAKDIKSVFPYLHLSKDEAKKAERLND